MSDPIITIEVDRRDIELGLPGQGDFCPIAAACRRQGHPNATVGTSTIDRLTAECGDAWGVMPKEAQEFAKAFDAAASADEREAMKPFEFKLEAHPYRVF